MNKKQLASKIWDEACELRGKISAPQYKDYILGFIFYKFLSEKEIQYLNKYLFFKKEDMSNVKEEDEMLRNTLQDHIGYFIGYKDLFSTWINNEEKFSVANVRDALNRFNRLVSKKYTRIFSGIFNTLLEGLDSLGTKESDRTTNIRRLLYLIDEIPMNSAHEYDVLGFVYEYLLKNFAFDAKKGGEFYTPHEVSMIMAEIVAHHLKGRQSVKIYDPAAGSGSLLISAGKVLKNYISNKNSIEYYAQEYIHSTYNICRMNLVMRNILPGNLNIRNGDTLEVDWPLLNESENLSDASFDPLYVDACVSNPPYSTNWKPNEHAQDVRFVNYGLAPIKRAEWAFLLHSLYHLKNDGIMTVVLPLGVLFRDGAEAEIRENLIKNNNIDAIITLPGNIFYSTPIGTLIMVLRKNKTTDDILFVDASKGFTKDGRLNVLREKHMKKIIDTVLGRKEIPKYSRIVSNNEIVANNYKLTMSKYVDSSEPALSYDLYATLNTGIPNNEINTLDTYFKEFPSLKNEMFKPFNDSYSIFVEKESNVANNKDVLNFKNKFETAFKDLPDIIKEKVLNHISDVNLFDAHNKIIDDIKQRMIGIPLIDYYDVYQCFEPIWKDIAMHTEMVQAESKRAISQVDPNIVVSKVKGNLIEKQDGWIGHILPFNLIQELHFSNKILEIENKKSEIKNIENELANIIENIDEEDYGDFLNDDNTEFKSTELNKKIKEIYEDMESDEVSALNKYLEIIKNKAKKVERMKYINSCSSVNWSAIVGSAPYTKTNIENYIKELQTQYVFPEDSFEALLIKASKLMNKKKALNSEVKTGLVNLNNETKDFIEHLSEENALNLLFIAWTKPLMERINGLPALIIDEFIRKVRELDEKYGATLLDVDSNIDNINQDIASMLSDLTGNEYDMKGTETLKRLLEGE